MILSIELLKSFFLILLNRTLRLILIDYMLSAIYGFVKEMIPKQAKLCLANASSINAIRKTKFKWL